MKQRIALWDNLKLFLMFLVVVGHLANNYYSETGEIFKSLILIIYTFHMPAFVFVSGLFAKKAINSEKIPSRKIFVFIVLYILARVINYAVNIIYFGQKIEFNIFYASDMPWYMMAMALWYAVTWAVRKIDSKYILAVSIALSCFAGYMSGDVDFLSILRVITFYPFFYSGYILDPEKIDRFSAKTPVKIFSAIYLAAFSVCCFVKYNFASKFYPLITGKGRFSDSAIKEFFNYGYALRFAYYIGVGLLVLAVISLCPRKEFKITRYGGRSLQIYIFHRAFLYILGNFGLLEMIPSIGPGWELIGIGVCVLITAVLCLKIFSIPINYISNPKPRKNIE